YKHQRACPHREHVRSVARLSLFAGSRSPVAMEQGGRIRTNQPREMLDPACGATMRAGTGKGIPKMRIIRNREILARYAADNDIHSITGIMLECDDLDVTATPAEVLEKIETGEI